MRVVFVLLVAAVLAAVAALVWWPSGDDTPPLAGAPPANAVSGANESPAAAAAPGPPPAPTAAVANAVATRLQVPEPSTEGLADQPTACLLVVDHDGGRALAGAAVRRVQGGAELAFSDERGLASVPLKQPEQLAVVLDGYLLRMAPTTPGSTEAEPQRVALVRDRWSLRRRFVFPGDAGPPGEVLVRFRPQAGSGADAGPPAGDAVLQRAWTEHTLLGSRPVCADVPVQLGTWSEDKVHRLGDGAEVRFAAAGEFTIEAATTAGEVGSASFRIEPGRIDGEAIRVALARGEFVAGTVVGGLQPLAGATLTLQGGEPLGLCATTGADGAFRFGPLRKGRATLLVRHGDHLPLAYGPVEAPASGVRIVLQRLPQSTLRGRVRSRPDLRPVAGAQVSWTPVGGAVVTATTGPDGAFQLAATGEQAARLVVAAPGLLPYAELVTPGAPFADFDLWPNTTAVRLAKGLSAVLAGTVVDAAGRALPGVSVRWIPARPTPPIGAPGRRVLDGGALELPLIVATGPDGAFVLETTQFGQGRLCLAEDGPAAPGGVPAEAVAGATKDGLRVPR